MSFRFFSLNFLQITEIFFFTYLCCGVEKKKSAVSFRKLERLIGKDQQRGGGGEGGGVATPLVGTFHENCWAYSRAVSLTWVGLPTYKPTAHCLGLAFLQTKSGSTTLASKPYRYLPHTTKYDNSEQ
jgi:hypothetical protein